VEMWMNSNRLLGIVLSVLGLGVAVLASLWLAAQVSAEQMTTGGALVGAGLAFVPVILLIGAGIYLYIRGGGEAEQQSVMQKQRRLMDVISSRGQVTVEDVALEIGVPVSELKEMVHQLVGLQVFSGYVNWSEGTLYSVEADQLRELKQCKNCGGELKLAGKGVVTCPFCGTEYFLR
jgi:Zn finger protein HypA/HybF involved in hydrogenase expression